MDPVNPELVGDWPLPPVVQSDHVPSESEQEQIANRIRTMELAQENLENEIEEVKRSLELRIAEARAKREMIESLKGSLSAIRRLPDELLGEVFVFCVRLGGTSPWVLTHVSQRFRRIAFNTRKLWTMITIPSKKLKKRPYTYKFYRHHCGDIQSLRYILSLSGKAPLDVIVEQSSDEVALTLVQERERWDILEFHNYHSGHSIMFRVTNLGMANIILDFRQNFSTLLQKVSKRLTRLNLVNILFPGESTIQFPRLRELAVNDVDGWHHIGCKNLQKIKLLQVAAFPTKIDYPEVQELEVGHYNLDTILGQLDLPNLDTLTISGQWWYSSRDWRNIKRLRLRLDGSSYSNLAYQLRPLHHVEILEVYDTPLALPFLKKFEAGQKRSPIFAVLKQFLVDYRQIGTKVAKDKLTEAFQAIVQSRKSNHPLEKLTVDWPLRQGGGMTEFV
ncbi:hypothetical protein FRC16_000272 [Serendipita sp. 398]|nr:hypothetical protein FRC16_000272 [Serendipita sp. 398]